ncbi:hypothetical protein IMZ48_46150 [Candidatus Bathyarchaeota archaeon]|nr:hypothetical protein [Candidatus Bathyarchaeota archaeon]
MLQLETAADNTKGMRAALRPLVNVRDIAISCDPGWGRLLGPEYLDIATKEIAARLLNDHQKIGLPTVLDRPLSRHTPLPENLTTPAESAAQRRHSSIMNMVLNAGIAKDHLASMMKSVDVMASTLFLKEAEPGLMPKRLTKGQMEFLMELEWASRAFVQSWAISISDLSRRGSFRHLTCVRLAKIPSSHLPIFTSADFWDSLSAVNEVHLQVLADWRRLSRGQVPGVVTDEAVQPVEATSNAFQLLRLISAQRNITTLHFEWLCGGELSWGSQRGRYILPVPLAPSPDQIVRTISNPEDILFFPHVTKLSLKNCWSSPHVFLHVMRRMARSSLVELKLESVSLSGPVVATPDPWWQGTAPLRELLEDYALRLARPSRPAAAPAPVIAGVDPTMAALNLMQFPGPITNAPFGPVLAPDPASAGVNAPVLPFQLPPAPGPNANAFDAAWALWDPNTNTPPGPVPAQGPAMAGVADPVLPFQPVLAPNANTNAHPGGWEFPDNWALPDPITTPELMLTPGPAIAGVTDPVLPFQPVTAPNPNTNTPPAAWALPDPNTDTPPVAWALQDPNTNTPPDIVFFPEPNPNTPPWFALANQPPPSPHPFTWPDIIDTLTSGPEMPAPRRPMIERMEFKSCGYVAVESTRIDTSRLGTWESFAEHYRWMSAELVSPSWVHIPTTVETHPDLRGSIRRVGNDAMQSSWSQFNGWVAPRLPEGEEAALRDGLGMRMGWEGVHDARTIALAKTVNPNEPGQGRFSGVVYGEKGS